MAPTQPNPDLYHIPWEIDQFHGMPYRWLGQSGLRVSNVGLGTWKMGYPETEDDARVDEATAWSIFDRAVDLGVTFWDTANRYSSSSGNSERIIGRWLKNNPGQRRNLVLGTKIYAGMDGFTPNHCRLSRGNILDSVYACLERLQVDYIDLLYFHKIDLRTSIEESLTAIEDLVSRDLIRYFGVSNFTVEQLDAYQAVAKTLSVRCRIAAVQNQFDLLHGESEARPGVLKHAAQTGMSLVPWAPLARGLLSERYLDTATVGPGNRLFDEGTLDQDLTPDVFALLQQLAVLARQWDLSLSQLAIAYMLALPGMGPVIAAVSNVKQLESNAAAGKVRLDTAQLRQVQQCLASHNRQSANG